MEDEIAYQEGIDSSSSPQLFAAQETAFLGMLELDENEKIHNEKSETLGFSGSGFQNDVSSSKPYDPLTNYLSPRPRYLWYNPCRRRRSIFLDLENRGSEENDDAGDKISTCVDSQKFSDDEGSQGNAQDISDFPCEDKSESVNNEMPGEEESENVENEEEEQEDGDDDVSEEEFFEGRGWNLKRVIVFLLKILFVFSLMSCLMFSPTEKCLRDTYHAYEVSIGAIEERNEYHIRTQDSPSSFLELYEIDVYREPVKVELIKDKDLLENGLSELLHHELEHKETKEAIKLEDAFDQLMKSEINPISELRKDPDLLHKHKALDKTVIFTEYQALESDNGVAIPDASTTESLSALIREFKAEYEEWLELYDAWLKRVEDGPEDLDDEVILSDACGSEEVEMKSNYASKTENSSALTRELDQSKAEYETLQETVEGVPADISGEVITPEKMTNFDIASYTSSEVVEMKSKYAKSWKIGFILATFVSVLAFAIFCYSVNRTSSSQVSRPMNEQLKNSSRIEVLAPVIQKAEAGHIERKSESFAEVPSLSGSTEEASKLHGYDSKLLQLDKSYRVEMSSPLLPSNEVENFYRKTESSAESLPSQCSVRPKETNKYSVSSGSGVHPSRQSSSDPSAADSPSYGSFTEEESIFKKEGKAKKAIKIPVRRSSRIRNRSVMSP